MPHKFHATICMIAWRKKDKGDWDAKVQPSSNATNTFKGKKNNERDTETNTIS
jgi:hypothetical protein